MITWKLWYALNHPPATHPIFWRTLQHYQHNNPYNMNRAALGWLDKLAILYLIVFIGLMFIANQAAPGMQSALLSLLIVLLAIPIILPVALVLRSTIFSGSYYGLLWAGYINDLIVHERQNNTYDLLWLFPGGILAPIWAMCMGCLYSNYRFNQLEALHTYKLRFIAYTALIGLLLRLTSQPQDPFTFILIYAIRTFALVLVVHIEFVQSLIIALLLGILAPLYSQQQIDARLWTISGFLFIQLNIYAVTVLIGLFLLPIFTSQLALSEDASSVIHILLSLTVFYLMRELVIAVLWRWLLWLTATSYTHSESVLLSRG